MNNFWILALVFFMFTSCENSTLEKKEVVEEGSLDSIQILPNWSDKEVVNLEIRKTKTMIRQGVLRPVNSSSNIELVILKKSDESWLGNWKINGIGGSPMSNPIDRKLERLFNDFEYNFILDSLGTIVDLVNWQDIQAKGQEALNILLDEIKNDPTMNPQIIEQIRINVGQIFDSKKKIQEHLMTDANLYFFVMGIEMSKLDTINDTVYTPHPLTGDLLKQNISILYQRAYSDSTVDIRLMQSLDESEVYDVVKNSIEEVGGEEAVTDFNEKLNDANFSLEIITDFNVSLKSGLVQKLTSKETVMVGEDGQIEETVIIIK